jgi:hypothetical protein
MKEPKPRGRKPRGRSTAKTNNDSFELILAAIRDREVGKRTHRARTPTRLRGR